MEVGELPGPARERATADRGGECAVAERGVVSWSRQVEDHVTVQIPKTVHGGIDDPRADLDCSEVRGRDRAERPIRAVVFRALLRHMESSASRGRRQRRGDRRSGGSLIAGRSRRQTRHSRSRAWTCRNPASVGTPDGGQRPSTETPNNHEFHTPSFGVAARFLTAANARRTDALESVACMEIAQAASITGQRDKAGL